jgi:hypothetical protein
MIHAFEISDGLVARFDPAELVTNGGSPNRRLDLAVAGPHYFVCLGPCGQYSVWTPAFSRHRLGRTKIGWKCGSADWVETDSYVDLTQLWIIPDVAVERASATADRTQRGSRNRASLSFLIPVEDRHQVS